MLPNLFVYSDRTFDHVKVTGTDVLPNINSAHPPINTTGAIAYDTVTQKVFFNNGSVWSPIATSSGSTLESYSLILQNNQVISPNIPTLLAPYVAPSPYHAISNWDLSTGIFTADQPEYLSINASVDWAPGTSNLGTRYLTVLRYDASTSITSIVKEVIGQASPSVNIDTSQELSINLQLGTGDQIWCEVEHNAPISLTISGGDGTSLCGFLLL